MSVVTFLAKEGTRVLPGDVLYSHQLSQHNSASGEVDLDKEHEVQCGAGCVLRRVVRRSRDATTEPIVLRRIVSRLEGQVHWVSGTMVSVASTKQASLTTDATESSEEQQQSASASTAAAAASQWRSDAFGPLVGDTVLVRISRVTKTFAMGAIVAVRGKWSSSKSGAQHGFRGVLRAEDIRPFRPTKDKLTPDPVDLSMRPGDVVAAVVLSQSDAKQYQLSTIEPQLGVVESTVDVAMDDGNIDAQHVVGPKRTVLLVPIPRQRDGLLNPVTGEVVPRWGPLVHQ